MSLEYHNMYKIHDNKFWQFYASCSWVGVMNVFYAFISALIQLILHRRNTQTTKKRLKTSYDRK